MKSSSPSGHGLSEGREYTLKLGSSFQNGARSQESYHVLRYDFKPASIDTSQPAEVKFGSNKECTVTYPNHDQGSTTFKGGRKPCSKECILIIDKATGEITLERISSNIPLKKSRTGTVDRSGDIRKSGNVSLASKTKTTVKSNKNSDTSTSSSQPTNSSTTNETSASINHSTSSHHKQNGQMNKVPVTKVAEQKPKDVSGSSSSDSSSDSDSSDSDSDVEQHAKTLDSFNNIATPYDPPPPSTAHSNDHHQLGSTNKGSNILQDLQLSDSNSDSDSD